ncbi:MAG: ParB-like nuclease domain-containing protein [Desulfurococcales archaeon]|nr:ParB-like nuclease domain-containing protein [Desulfurococcales archaeon]
MMGDLPGRLRLDSWRDIESRLPKITRMLNLRYSVRFLGKRRLDPRRLYSTEPGLESDKLGLVLYSMLYRGYDAPIVTVLGYGGRLYIIDGHHRARAALWLERLVDSYLIEARAYKPRVTMPLEKTPIINPPETVSEYVHVLRHIVNIIYFLEKSHGVRARVWRDVIRIEDLYATQPLSKPVREKWHEEMLPPLVYRWGKEYYVVDGHTRVCSALLAGLEVVDAIVFTLNKEIGLVKTSHSIGSPRFNHSYCRKKN